jgi:phosphoribosylaminoimidazolecarboxamide formyltransferase/IMP cyclohydrolase
MSPARSSRAPGGLNTVDRADDLVPVRRAIVSVADKSGLERLIPSLLESCPGIVFYSTGGTHREIARLLGADAAGRLVAVSEYTGQPEMQGGLVKTLDFRIYLGLLSETYNPEHTADLRRAGAVTFDMVVGNLYPFSDAIRRAGATPETARGNIDIGGPCMIRAAAKNFLRVAALVDPADYAGVLAELRDRRGSLSLATRYRLAQKAFAHTAGYDGAIARYLAERPFAEVTSCYALEGRA